MTIDTTSVSLLVRLRDQGDAEAWREFHEIYAPIVEAWLTRQDVQSQDAEDVRQEVMQLAAQELRQFKHNGRTGALRCWLRQVMANRLRTYRRQQNRNGMALGGSDYRALADQLEDPRSALSQLWDTEYDREVCRKLLLKVQSEFTTTTMAAFRAVAIEERSAAEAGAALGITSNAVRIAQFRVLRRLNELGQEMLD